jgi:hypothetical protein
MFHRAVPRLPILALAVALSSAPLLAKTPVKAPPPPPPALLPTDFDGWHLATPPSSSTAPETADAANADLLKEDGFAQFSAATYTRNADKLNVRAIRFADASGAYAAYTYYRRPGLPKQEVGYGGVFDGSRVLFWQSATVVDATFDHLTGMSAAELRDLAAALPKAESGAAIPPPLPGYLPQKNLDGQSTRYALGPIGYLRGGGVLPPSLVDFDRGAEVLTTQYSSPNGDGTLTLIDYPTPQLAAERQNAAAAFLAAGNTPASPWSTGLTSSSPAALQSRRSGPLVAVTSGSFSASDARELLSSVNYSPDVTWNHPQGYNSEVSKAARLLIGIITLTAVLGGAAILLGLFFGGGRALYRRIRGKPASTMADAEFISLHLGE